MMITKSCLYQLRFLSYYQLRVANAQSPLFKVTAVDGVIPTQFLSCMPGVNGLNDRNLDASGGSERDAHN